jgi:hypothetical protein
LLGSWWAYHELGWWGWWFWDLVEDVFVNALDIGYSFYSFSHFT